MAENRYGTSLNVFLTLTPGAAIKDIHLHSQLSLPDTVHDMTRMFISGVGLQLPKHH